MYLKNKELDFPTNNLFKTTIYRHNSTIILINNSITQYIVHDYHSISTIRYLDRCYKLNWTHLGIRF